LTPFLFVISKLIRDTLLRLSVKTYFIAINKVHSTIFNVEYLLFSSIPQSFHPINLLFSKRLLNFRLWDTAKNT
jgi:hypothetical protein